MALEIATRIIDGDGHVLEDLAAIRAHLEMPYRELVWQSIFPPIDHLHSATTVQTKPDRDGRKRDIGPDDWIRFLTEAGIESTVLYPSWGNANGKVVNLNYAVAISRAYNNWIAEEYVKRDRRFQGMAILPLQDPPEAAKELRRAVVELGLIGAVMPSNGLPHPLGAKVYWPVYEEANRLGCPLAVHGGAHDRWGLDHFNRYGPVNALGHPWGLTLNCADIVFNGIFDRFPKVRLAFLEGGVGWLLFMLERLHAAHETHFEYIPPDDFGIREGDDPLEYVKALIANDRLYLGIETEELTLPFALKVVGNRAFMYSSDFPHEVTLQSCKHDIGELLESDEMSSEDKTAMLCLNAERFYQLRP